MASTGIHPTLQITVVSDVVYPWSFVGFCELGAVLKQENMLTRLRRHPLELSPEGQNLREHIAEKCKSTPRQSRHAHDQLTALDVELGFSFNLKEDSRVANILAAHRLLDWAETPGDNNRSNWHCARFISQASWRSPATRCYWAR